MTGKELEMMTKIIRDNIDRDIETESKMNTLAGNMKQEAVPELYFDLLRDFNDMALYINFTLCKYLDQEMTIGDAIDQIKKVLLQLADSYYETKKGCKS